MALVAMGVLAGGCSSSREPVEEPAGLSDQVELEVSSQHRSDVTVYAEGRGPRVRLGVVETMGNRTFMVPQDVMNGDGSMRLIADPIGSSRPHQTGDILIQRGDFVEWVLASQISLSSYSVRRGAAR